MQDKINEALDPLTSPQRLAILAEVQDGIQDEAIRRVVAGNPNAPLAILLKLGADFPDVLIENPILLLAFLENPRLMDEMPEETAVALLREPKATDALLRLALSTRKRKYLHIIADRARLPDEVRHILKESKASDVRLAMHLRTDSGEVLEPYWEERAWKIIETTLKAHTKATFEQPYLLLYLKHARLSEAQFHFFSRHSSDSVRQSIAANPQMPVGMMEEMAKTPSSANILGLALNPKLPPVLIEKCFELALKMRFGYYNEGNRVMQPLFAHPHFPLPLIQKAVMHENVYLRYFAAQHPRLSAAQAALLVKDEGALNDWSFPQQDRKVRDVVLRNPNLPPDVMREMAQLSDENVRMNVGENPNATPDVLHILAQDKREFIRIRASKHPNTEGKVLQILAKDRKKDVRAAVAENPRLPAELMPLLATDKTPEVRAKMAQHPHLPLNLAENLMHGSDGTVRTALLGYPKLPSAWFEKLAHDADVNVRAAVAEHPQAPPHLLRAFLADSQPEVRRHLVKNPNLPVEVLRALVHDTDQQVQLDLAHHPHVPPDVLKHLILEEGALILGFYGVDKLEKAAIIGQNLVPIFPDVLVRSKESSYFMLGCWLGASVGQDILREKARLGQWQERYMVAVHPETPPDVLKMLAQDINRYVRAKAASRV
jgi:hypothetical protein